jgi:nucleotide-binding universal stress UspA family protein
VILTVSTLTADLALTAPGFARALGLVPELERADRRAAKRILTKAARQARMGKRATLRYYRPERRLFAESAILEEAKRQRADVVVLGRTGRTALGDVLMGSVAQRVLALATRPVVLVPGRRGRS